VPKSVVKVTTAMCSRSLPQHRPYPQNSIDSGKQR
jgi:hypothetical protein